MLYRLKGSEPVLTHALPCSHDSHGHFDCGPIGDPIPDFDHDHCLQYDFKCFPWSVTAVLSNAHRVPLPSSCVTIIIYYTWPCSSGKCGLEIRDIVSRNTFGKCQFCAKYFCNHEAFPNT